LLLISPQVVSADEPANIQGTDLYHRIKSHLDTVPAIDTHDHLRSFELLAGRVETDRGNGMTLESVWRNSYLSWINRITPWKVGGSFDDWWPKGKQDFDNVRTTSGYRYTHTAIQALYGVDFDTITDAQARDLNDRIFDNYGDQKWLYEVVTEKANIELMFNDPFWGRLDFKTSYPWEVLVFNVTSLFQGYHPSNFQSFSDNPYRAVVAEGRKVESLDNYLDLLDTLFVKAKASGAVCLKTTIAYQRTLNFENVPKARAELAFGKLPETLTPEQIKDFEDFIMWRLCELSAKHELPFQIHTGHARIQGSNPMLLVDLMAENPETKFILFHGGFPWIGESGMIVAHSLRKAKNVWIDSVWLPTLSYETAKRAYHEWLDLIPSDRIMWGADCQHAEGIYGATEMTRRCLAEVLAERIDRGHVKEDVALHIGRQILRDNALTLFPLLKERLWKQKGRLQPPSPPNNDGKD
jgi:uncharacterized protein